MSDQEDLDKLGFSHSGLVARSPEGHAARGMAIKGEENLWVGIQKKTFTNWVNEQLRQVGLEVADLQTDFCNGLKLVALIEVLQKRRLKKIAKPINHHQYLENVQIALNAITNDGIKLVNIGNTDIVDGNLKLILGLVWSLIVHYQIGRSRFPAKKLMLAWLNAALPENKITNLTTDWNSGKNLCALLNYCKPTLFPDWRNLDPRDRVNNCRDAMRVAKKEFNIPMILTPDDLASHNLDELSGMTYLSYFMRPESPGYFASLNWIRKQIPHMDIRNFTSDWNDGVALCHLTRSLGASIKGYSNLSHAAKHWEHNQDLGMRAGSSLGVESILTAKEMTERDVDYLGIMAYTSAFQWVKPMKPAGQRISITGTDLNNCHVNKQAHFKINLLDVKVDVKKISVKIIGPTKPLECRLNLAKNECSGEFTPTEDGIHELCAYYNNELVEGCPMSIKVHPDLSKIMFSGIDPCAIGSIVEVLINSKGAGGGAVRVDATAPSDKIKSCPVSEEKKGIYMAKFSPNEIGEWKIAVTYSGQHIHGSPFTCYVYDPSKVKLIGLDPGLVDEELCFVADSSRAGWGDIKIEVSHAGRDVPCYVDERGNGQYKVKFKPRNSGRHKIHVHYNGIQVRGSPFNVEIFDTTDSLNLHNQRQKQKMAQHRSESPRDKHRNRDEFYVRHERDNDYRSERDSFSKVKPNYDYGSGRHERNNDYRSERDSFSKSRPNYDYGSHRHEHDNGHRSDRDSFSKVKPDYDYNSGPRQPRTSAAVYNVARNDSKERQYRHEVARSNSKERVLREDADYRRENAVSHRASNHQSVNKTSHSVARSNSNERVLREDRSADYHQVNASSHSVARSNSKERVLHEYDKYQDYHHHEAKHVQNGSRHEHDWAVNGKHEHKAPEIKRKTSDYRNRQRGAAELRSGQKEYEFGDELKSRIPVPKKPIESPSKIHDKLDVVVAKGRTSAVHEKSDQIYRQSIEKEPAVKSAPRENHERRVNALRMHDELKSRSAEFRLRSEERMANEKNELDTSIRSGYVKSIDIDNVTLRGEEDLKLLMMGNAGEFSIRSDQNLQLNDVKVVVEAPSGGNVDVKLKERSDGFVVRFEAKEVGEHAVDVYIQGRKMKECPLHCYVFDANRIKVGRIPDGVVGKSIEFEIDGSLAGSGNLEILVNGGHVTSQVRNLGNHRFIASFIPHSAMSHTIEMKFNGVSVPGSAWSCEIKDPSSNIVMRGEGIKSFSCERPTMFDIIAADFRKSDIDVDISSPSEKPVKYKLVERPGGRFSVEFKSSEVGVHTINVSVDKIAVLGSPFLSKAYNASMISVSKVKDVLFNEPFDFTVDASEAGEGQLEISINDGEVPNEVQVLGGGKCIVTFMPEVLEPHKIDIHFNGESVPGSPFIANIIESYKSAPKITSYHLQQHADEDRRKYSSSSSASLASSPRLHQRVEAHEVDSSIKRSTDHYYEASSSSLSSDLSYEKIKLINELDLIPINRLASFDVEFSKSGKVDLLNIEITSPSKQKLPVKITNFGKSGFSAEFTPREIGVHHVDVEYDNQVVQGSPFKTKVFDARKVVIGHVPNGSVNKLLSFTVDASDAGEGNLEITVTADQSNVATQVESLGQAKFSVSFVPHIPTNHIIDVTFNNETVAGSPFYSKVYQAESINISGESLTTAAVSKTSSFTINNVAGNLSDFNVKVIDPEGSVVPAGIKEGANGSYKVDFSPLVTGDHQISVNVAGSPASGSPFVCKVYDVGQIKVRNIPKGVVGKPVTFFVETESAGPGNLEVTVDGGQVPTTAHAQASNLYAITFTPQHSHLHIIDLKFNGESVPGNPFSCSVMETETKITASGEGLEKVAVNRPTSFIVDPCNTPSSDLAVNILSPTRQNVPSKISGSSDQLYKVEYTPSEVGDHTINIMYDDATVAGSPYLVKAYDPAKVKVTDVGNGTVGKPIYFSIDASQAGAGNLEIIVSVNGRNVPNYVQSEGNAKFRVHFKPTEVQQHILSVKFNGEPVPGSPFNCQVTDTSSNYVVSGASLRIAAVGKSSKFTVDTRGVDKSECKVLITAPSGKLLPAKVEQEADKFDISFSPDEVGPHMIIVTLDGESISGSPFTCNVYDVDKIDVTGLKATAVGKPITFQVDASQAGEGTLELVVTTQKTSVRAEVAARSRGLYDVTFTPNDVMPHFVNITFNDEKVPGAPFKCDVINASGQSSQSIVARGEGLKQGLVGVPGVFEIDARGLQGQLDITVTGLGDKLIESTVTKTSSGTYRAEYNPKEIGTYKIEIYHANKAISSKPFLVEVCDPSRIKVIDVHDGLADQEQSFKIDTSKAGRGNLDVKINASSGQEVKNVVREIGTGLHEVLWTPKFGVPHNINVTYNSHNAPACPIDVSIGDSSHSIVATGTALRTSNVAKPSTFVINTKGFGEAKDFDVLISGPRDNVIPVKCYQQKDGNLLAEFTPTHTGAHKIDILHDNKPIPGSPYISQVFDASKVKIQRPTSKSYKVHEKIAFSMSRRDAGYAELDVTVTSPLGKNLPFEVKGTPDGEGEQIEFMPTVAGKYKISIKYGGAEAPGSPVTFMVEEPGTPKVYGDGLICGMQDEAVTFKIDVQGLTGEPHVQVDGPDSVAKCTLEQQSDGMYLVTYIPREVGLFDIRVFWNGREVTGSPFHPKITNPGKVRVIGGLESLMDDQNRLELTLNEEKKIPFDVSEAGPGKLRAEVRGPSGMINSVLDQTNVHRFKLSFTPNEEGEFFMYLYYADAALPKTPYVGYAKPLAGTLDHTKVSLRGHGISNARVAEEAEFIIDGSEAGPGSPEINMSGVKADIVVTMVPLGNNVYRANYTPNVPGSYVLNVTWSDRQVNGCPLKVAVTASADASKVICSGDGLRGGQYGKEIKSYIDTRRAGPGELTAQCVGPHKVAYCELYDHRDGTFTLFIKPQEGGRHVLTIKYGGEHVEGSPFNLRIAGPPDASKVRVYGPGIEPGVLAIYQSRFICDTRGAGAGQLTVRIRGPKGAFRVEMQRESQKDRTILCKYDPTEPGDYRVEVKWSGEHVPGSPFLVMIFDTQEELNRYLQGATNPSTPNSDYFRNNTNYGTSFGQMSWKGSQTLN